MRLFGNTTKMANDKDNAKIKMVEVSQLRFDRDFKNVFQQENDKVAEIANDMRVNGFDKSRPIIVTEAYIIVDGHSRFMAQRKRGSKRFLLSSKSLTVGMRQLNMSIRCS